MVYIKNAFDGEDYRYAEAIGYTIEGAENFISQLGIKDSQWENAVKIVGDATWEIERYCELLALTVNPYRKFNNISARKYHDFIIEVVTSKDSLGSAHTKIYYNNDTLLELDEKNMISEENDPNYVIDYFDSRIIDVYHQKLNDILFAITGINWLTDESIYSGNDIVDSSGEHEAPLPLMGSNRDDIDKISRQQQDFKRGAELFRQAYDMLNGEE